MTRKDTILISVIINAGLLAILFATAIIYDTDQEYVHEDTGSVLAEVAPPIVEQKISSPTPPQVKNDSPAIDEYDHVLRNYSASVQPAELEQETLVLQEPVAEARSEPSTVRPDYVEVTVKKGDSLDKIARANGTTVNAIKKASDLVNEKLTIGQTLRVPLTKETSKSTPTKALPSSPSKVAANSDAVYHVVKSGDSPWKIARMYGVKYEDILRLNKLDEDKARNLKIGDRIRVK